MKSNGNSLDFEGDLVKNLGGYMMYKIVADKAEMLSKATGSQAIRFKVTNQTGLDSSIYEWYPETNEFMAIAAVASIIN